MKITQNILTGSACYKAGRTITPVGAMIHSIGTPQNKASVVATVFNNSTNTGVHAVIDDTTCLQLLPWNRRAWHAGSPANDRYISVELCEPNTIKYTSGANFVDNDTKATKAYVEKVYKNAVDVFAQICKEYKFNPLDSNQLMSHSEGYKKGVATNHADVEHLWGKFGLTMDQFRKDVKTVMDSGTVDSIDTTAKENTNTGNTSASSNTGNTINNTISINQKWLNDTYNAGIAVDGKYGSATKAANVKGIQKEINAQFGGKLAVDGVFGTLSQAAWKNVSEDARGNITRNIQFRLYALGYNTNGVDGIFGSGTTGAVKAFQKAKGLKEDGIVGKNTIYALFK